MSEAAARGIVGGANVERQGRLYRGLTREQRDAQRRTRLLDSALELFGTRGYADTTIGQLCAAARITQRSFYEYFQTREDLLLALYDRLIETHAARVADALSDHPDDTAAALRAAVAAAVRGFLEDERAARVVMLEIVGAGARAERRRFEVINLYVEMIMREASALPGSEADTQSRGIAVALVGTVNESVIDWLVQGPQNRPAVREVIATLQRIFAVVLLA